MKPARALLCKQRRGVNLGNGYFASRGIIIDPAKRFDAKRIAAKYRLPAKTRIMWLALMGCWAAAFVTGLLFAIGGSSHWGKAALLVLMLASFLMFSVVGPGLWLLLHHRRTKALERCVREMHLLDVAILPGWADQLRPDQFVA